MKTPLIALGLAMLAGGARGQEWMDSLERRLSVRSRDGFVHAELSGFLDLEGYYVDQRPPGLLFEDESFFNPRLSLFLDTSVGPHLYSFVQARVDQGFDPGSKDFDGRFDEYLLRWTPWEDRRLNLQLGKFATVVGSWVQRHDSWQNPLINAPLPYENLTPVGDGEPPDSAAHLVARRKVPDQKDEWLPVIWGPVYATGGSLFGSIGQFDYGIEVKNASLSSHTYAWQPSDTLWKYPTVSGRLGWRAGPAWNQGVSFSIGPYLSAEAADALPPGKTIGDFNQYTLGYDLSYAWRRFEGWAELFLSRFEVPNAGNADLAAYYLEVRYKITAGLFAAARWNQELYGTVNTGPGANEAWGNDMFRIDAGLGYRFTRHFQTKVQYSFGHRTGTLQQGEQLVAVQATVRF